MIVRPLLAGLAALSLSASALAQPAAAPAATPAFSADAFRAHVTFLADDLLEGREAGTRGYDIASRYVATQFAALGLQPAGANGGWFQPVEFSRYTGGATGTMTVAGRTFTLGREMTMRATADVSAVAVDAPLVFVGYGIDMPSHGYDDYRGVDARGKIVVMLSGVPAGTPSDVAAHLNSEKRRMAGAHGAVGMITIRTRADAASAPWDRAARFGGRPGTTWVETNGTPYSDGGSLRFQASLSEEAAQQLFTAANRDLNAILDEAANRGRPRGFAMRISAQVTRDAGSQTRFQSQNVVAILPGTDPSVAN